ncbi:hypothetical protein C8Q75DRAFT_810923 [Abortiporus biennis]|nr:hypothetical protein C8Q75DRAFT_810923 [Abortiporus biennis]
MASQQALQEDQLFELLLQLKKTTPEQAKAILNAQPQIAYALMAVMVNINAVNVEVTQKTLTSFSGLQATATPAVPPPVVPPSSVIPPYMPPPVRGGTPTTYPQQGPPYGNLPPPTAGYPPYGGAPPQYNGTPVPNPPASTTLPPALANIPEDQKAVIMRVIAMTPEEIHRMPPQERASIIQLRTTLGLPA